MYVTVQTDVSEERKLFVRKYMQTDARTNICIINTADKDPSAAVRLLLPLWYQKKGNAGVPSG